MIPRSPQIDRRSLLLASAFALAPRAIADENNEHSLRESGAYTDQLSYLPGETVRFRLNIPTRYDVEIARMGSRRQTVWAKENVPASINAVPPDASATGCRWPDSLSLDIPPTWKTGYYEVVFKSHSEERPATPISTFFVVRPKNPGHESRILIQLSTNTYNAYTNWGGYSLYAYNGRDRVQGRRVSFDRPLISQFRNWELPFIAWAEDQGYALDYCVNSDLEFHPELLKNYRLVLSVGHDEYWSKPMRDNLEQFIANGGNVAFFSGNTCCWQVRSEVNGRQLVCWKQSFGDDPFYREKKYDRLSTLWSHHLVNRPENSLTGVGFLWGGYHRSHGQFMDGSGAFTTHNPQHWLFEGTQLERGSSFGGKDTIVGYECDGCELEWINGVPRPTHRDGTPESFQVLATAPARWHPDDCEWYERWEKGRTGNAVLGSYTGGGTVITVGTTDWSHGLRGQDPVVTRMTRNTLDKLGK